MELFVLLLLSFCYCQAKSLEGEEVDCDDPKVFKAVDLALRAYNDRREGNQFALVQVLEARETEGPGTNLQVTYRLKETSCAVGSGHWQECGYHSEADSGRCVAKVHYINRDSTVTQTCTILRAPEKVFTSVVSCLGCWYPMTNESSVLVPIVRYTIQQFNNQSEHPSYFDVGEIANAQRQVVSGWRYKFEYSIKETNCSKAEFSELTPDCKPIPGGRAGNCEVTAYVNISNTLVYASQDCKYQEDIAPLACFGCPRKIPFDDPDMLNALDVAVEKYNNESSDSFYYKLRQILAATSQLVAGVNYRVDFTIIRTNCSKDRVPKLRKDCTAILPTKLLNCRSTIYVRPWEFFTYPKVTCTKIMNEPSVQRIAIPGLTPFRKSRQAVNLAMVLPESKHKVGRHHGHGHGHKHGHKKQRSSEEFRDDGTNQEETLHETPDQPSTIKPILQEEGPSENPAGDLGGLPELPIPDSPGVSPDGPLFDPLPDLPAPPAHLCPGKLWQPIIAPTTPVEEKVSPTHRAFEDFDLLDALP